MHTKRRYNRTRRGLIIVPLSYKNRPSTFLSHYLMTIRKQQKPISIKPNLLWDPKCVITISRVRRDRFLLINSRYLRCRCSVTCFNLDKLQEVRPLGVVVFTIMSHARVSGHPVYYQVLYQEFDRILGCPVIPYPVELIFDSWIFVIKILFLF